MSRDEPNDTGHRSNLSNDFDLNPASMRNPRYFWRLAECQGLRYVYETESVLSERCG